MINWIKVAVFVLVCTSNAKSQQSFSLAEAVQYGLTNSIELKVKRIGQEDANQQVKEIKSIGIPKISGGVNYQHFLVVPSQPVQDFISPSIYGVLFEENVIPRRDLGEPQTFAFTLFQPNQLSANIEASSLVFDGSYLYGLKAAKFYRELASQETAVSAQKIKEQITKAYISVLITDENKKVINNNLENLGKSLNEIKALYENGFAESLDVDRIQLSYDNLTTELENLEQLILITKNLLKFQMNFPLDQEIMLTQTIDDLQSDWNANQIKETENLDFTKREEFKLLSLGQKLNELDLKRQKIGYYPTLRAFANLQGSLLRKNLFDNDETGIIPQSALGLSMNIPIYDGGERSAKIQRVKLNIQKNDLEMENLQKAILLQVSNAKLAYDNAVKKVNNRKKSLEVNQKIFDKTLIKFREGVGSSIEVTQAESNLYQAQGAYTNAVYDLLSALIDLQTSKGIL